MTKRITDTGIKAFLSSSDKEWLFDSRRVEFRANSKRTGGTFYDVVYQGHLKKRTVLGKWPAIKAVDLFKRLSEIQVQLKAGQRSSARADDFTHVEQVLVWFSDHVEQDSSFSSSYSDNANSSIYNHLIPSFSGLAVSSLTRNEVFKRFYKDKVGSLALSSIKSYFSVLKRSFSLAESLGLIASNPLSNVKWTDFSKERIKPTSGKLKPYSLCDVIKEVHESQFHRRLFFVMELVFGTRIGETCLIEWAHISLEKKEYYLPEDNTKTSVELRLPIPDKIVDLLVLARAKNRSDYVFNVRGNAAVSSRTVSNWYKDLSDRVGVKFTSHDFRKLARDSWQQNGVDSDVSEMLLNHSRGNLKGTYTSQYAWPIMKKALDEWASEVFGGG